MDAGTSVKVAVRIRPLNSDEFLEDGQLCINTVPGVPQVTITQIQSCDRQIATSQS